MPYARLAAGAAVVGTLDLADAVVFFWLRSGTAPIRIFQSIAAGALGRAAFTGGTRAAAIGVALHFLIASLIVLTYYGLSRVIPLMRMRLVAGGLTFGLAAYCVMNYVVIPLSATSRGAFVWPVFVNGVAIHMLGVGLPAAWFAGQAKTTP